MKPAPSKEEVLDEILLTLADDFESPNPRGRLITADKEHPEEFEPLRECIANVISERWLTQWIPFPVYYLTPEGYRHFTSRIQALRTLGKS